MKRLGTLLRTRSLLVNTATLLAAIAPALVVLTTPATAWGADEKPQKSSDAGASSKALANEATEREKKSRAAGQASLADRLVALAQVWLRVAAAQQKAAELEAQADAIERQTLELEAQMRRGASLVEQTEARRARALAKLQELGLASEVENLTAPSAPKVPAPQGDAR